MYKRQTSTIANKKTNREDDLMEQNPFWGEPTPTDLWDDMDKLNELYEELGWDHIDYLEFAIEGNHITIRNRSREGR